MPTNAFDNYFIPVDAASQNINFTSGFSTSLVNVLSDINENFERIISAPFIQGDTGRSVIKVEENIYKTGTQEFTDFGKTLVSAIYGEDIYMTSIDTYHDLCEYINNHLYSSDITTIDDGGTSTDYYSCQYLDHLSSVDCYMIEPDSGTEDKIFVSLVFFIDERISVLQEHQDIWEDNFIDRSCVLYGKAEYDDVNDEYTWEIKRYQLFPNLYWNSELGQFCWEINGVQTEVCAQGLKGDQGPEIPCWSCEGIRYTGNTGQGSLALNSQVWITDVLSTNQDIDNPLPSDIHDGDVIFIWFAEENAETPGTLLSPDFEKIKNFTIGIAKSNPTGVYVDYNNVYDFRTITDNVVLRTQLINTGFSNLDPKHDLRGLFLSADGNVMSPYPSVSNPIHYIYSASENSVNNLHVVPTRYENTFSTRLRSTDTAPSNDENSLLCIDYNGIRSIPMDPSSIDDTYLYELSLTKDYLYEKLSNNNKNAFCVSLPLGGPDIKINPTAELGLMAQDKKHVIFLGGNGSNISPNNIVERMGYNYTRRTYGGSGYVYDISPSIQVLRGTDSGTEKVYANEDYETWKSIFNFAPYGTMDPGDENASALNLSYRKHIGLSEPDEQHSVALCFTPKADYVEDDNGTKFLRIYLPSVGYVRDTAERTFASNDYQSIAFNADFNWNGWGGLCRSDADQHNGLSSEFPSEVFLYNRDRFLSVENTPSENNNVRDIDQISLGTNFGDLFCSYASYVFRNSNNVATDKTKYNGGLRYSKGNNYIDISINPFFSLNSNQSRSVIYFRGGDSGSFYRPLLSTKLERPFYIYDTNNNKYNLADYLYIAYIVIKNIPVLENGVRKFEVCVEFTDPRSFDDNNVNSGYDSSAFNITRSILKLVTQNTEPNYKEQSINGEYVALQKYGDSGWQSNIFKNHVAINFVVTVDSNTKKVTSLTPSCQQLDNHAAFAPFTGNAQDTWILSCDEDDDISHSTIIPKRFEEFSWWTLNSNNQEVNTYGSPFVVNNKVFRFHNYDRLYLEPSDYVGPWTDDGIEVYSRNIPYNKYYDFYELEMGNTRFGSKPRRPLIESISTDAFTVYDEGDDLKVASIKLNYINDQHDINIYGIDNSGTYDPDSRSLMTTLGALTSVAALGRLTQMNNDNMSLRSSLGTTNNNLSNLTEELNQDNINVTPLYQQPSDSTQNEIRSNEAINISKLI